MATFRASLSGINALTNTDPKNFSVYADSDNVLIKEFSRGSGDTSVSSTVSHSLGYVPFHIVMGEIAAGEYEIATGYDVNSGSWRTISDNNDLTIDDDGVNNDFYYYIFYDDFSF